MRTTNYLADNEYHRLVAALVRIAPVVPSLKIGPSLWTGRIEPDDVKIALGEQFDIWPASIIPHLDPEDRPASG
jgi:hypothetical protein